jgi:CrcB protein
MQSRLSLVDAFYIGLGGMLGSLLRWWVGLGFEGSFPVPTLMINILGAAALGVLYASQHKMQAQGKYLYMVGFCGSFTTVSLFSLETIQLLNQGQWLFAIGNILLPVVVSLVIVAVIIRPIEESVERRRK